MDLLDEFLAEQVAHPWAWGTHDCSIVLAAWCMANGHADPASDLRGRYGESWLADLGWPDLLSLVSALAAKAALSPAAFPVRGAIGVIGSRHRADRQWGAIHDGIFWRVRAGDSFVQMRAMALAMWKV